jgi:hypothetical protein
VTVNSARDDDLRDLMRLVARARTSKQLGGVLRTAAIIEGKDSPHEDELWHVRTSTFDALQELTDGNSDQALEVMLEFLLPLCLRRTPVSAQGGGYHTHLYRQRLRTWLDRFQESDQAFVRDGVMCELLTRLKSSRPEEACWTITEIGFRRRSIVAGLWRVVRAYDDECGDAALSALASLGVPNHARKRLRDELHRRVEGGRFSLPLAGAAKAIADPKTIDVVKRNWLGPGETGKLTFGAHIALTLLSDIADKSTAGNVHRSAWEAIVERIEARSGQFSPVLHLDSRLASQCDDTDVIPYLIDWMGRDAGEDEEASHRRSLLCHRLGELVRPHQLEGWGLVADSVGADSLFQDVSVDTRVPWTSQTSAGLLKQIAWETLLCLGDQRVLAPETFELCVSHEASVYTRQDLMRKLACFQLNPLPEAAVRWVTEVHDEKRTTSPAESPFRMPAIRLLASSPSPESFEALRSFGFTYEGHVLRDSVDCLAEVAVALACKDPEMVAEAILDGAKTDSEPRHRTAAAGALHTLAAEDLLPIGVVPVLESLAVDQSLAPFDRGHIVGCLGLVPVSALAPSTLTHLRDWAQGEATPPDIKWRSLVALAQLHLLENDPELIENGLRLRLRGRFWEFDSNATQDEHTTIVISILYRRRPNAFAKAMATIIQNGDWIAAIQAMDGIVAAHPTANRGKPPRPIVRALIRSVKKPAWGMSPAAHMLGVLGRLAPDALAREKWPRMVDNWPAEMRATLAGVLGRAQYSRARSRDAALATLEVLAQDSAYKVRRAAYCSLQIAFPDALRSLVVEAADHSDVQVRRRSAEAWSWIAGGKHPSTDTMQLYRRLEADPEPSVRAAAAQAFTDWRERSWAQEYCELVTSIAEDHSRQSSDAILHLWRYGHALAHVGDDLSAEAIERALRNPDLLPHARYWLTLVRDGIDERWKKVSKTWS